MEFAADSGVKAVRGNPTERAAALTAAVWAVIQALQADRHTMGDTGWHRIGTGWNSPQITPYAQVRGRWHGWHGYTGIQAKRRGGDAGDAGCGASFVPGAPEKIVSPMPGDTGKMAWIGTPHKEQPFVTGCSDALTLTRLIPSRNNLQDDGICGEGFPTSDLTKVVAGQVF